MNLKRLFPQKACVWSVSGRTRTGGKTFNTAVQIDCRWESISKVVLEGANEEFISAHHVYTDTALSIGDYISLVSLDDLSSSPNDPQEVASYEIKWTDVIPSISGGLSLCIAYL
jgi:hypothetical protein